MKVFTPLFQAIIALGTVLGGLIFAFNLLLSYQKRHRTLKSRTGRNKTDDQKPFSQAI